MDDSLVIKVKYGGTLRRFNARVDENNHLDLDMAGLRAKILSFFDFAADSNLVLRYVDEDGDLVTLVDDADLQDVMKQNLKFLKIDVLVSNGSGAKSNGSSSGSVAATPSGSVAATPSGSAAATPRSPPTPNPSITTKVVFPPDAFKAVPEPIRGSVEKFTTDMLSSSPVASAIIDSVIKGIPVPNPHGQAHAAPGPSSGNGAPKESSSPEARVPRSTSGDSTSNNTQQAKPENADRGVPNAGRPVPENLREAFSKLTIDLLSSNPMTAGLADFLSKAGDPARRGPPVIPLPENLHETLSKLANDLRSSGPITVNLGDSLSKIGIPNISPYFQASVAAGVGSNNGVPKESTSSAARGTRPRRVDSSSNADQTLEAGNVTRGVAAGVTTHVDLNTLPTDPNSSQSTNLHAVPVSPAVPGGDGKKGKKCADNSSAWKGESSGTFPNYPVPNTMPVQTAATGSGAFNACPYARAAPVDFGQGFAFGPGPDVPVNMVPPRQGFAFAPRIPLVPPMGKQGTHSFKRSPNHTEASGMFHKGVRCDGCGIYPITGPRFKSKVKENYDLCNICFNERGNESDYIRIDRPLSARGSHCFSGGHAYSPRNPPGPHDIMHALSKYAKPKLDSRFILDVNVIDGTMMAPSTAFTKIWRMRNNGTQVWPQGTQLVWTGGDQFSDIQSVYLEVPEDGVPVDKELDIAVDFIAPLLPGRYVSYWRMASPSGHRFGQRVWVLIQVDASLKDSFYDSSQGLNLNIPLVVDGDGSKGPLIIDINAQPTEDDDFLQHLNPDVPTEPVNQVADKQPTQDLENKLPVDEAKFVGSADSTPAPATSMPPSSSVSYPIIDLSATSPAVPSDQQSSAVDAQPTALPLGSGGGNNPVEETMLKELEEMGFRQVDLNKEILRMNEYNLEQSVDDLCGVSEWDPILEELQEMGFHDNEMNKRLLKKNNGSIKRVVMDLINGGD